MDFLDFLRLLRVGDQVRVTHAGGSMPDMFLFEIHSADKFANTIYAFPAIQLEQSSRLEILITYAMRSLQKELDAGGSVGQKGPTSPSFQN